MGGTTGGLAESFGEYLRLRFEAHAAGETHAGNEMNAVRLRQSMTARHGRHLTEKAEAFFWAGIGDAA